MLVYVLALKFKNACFGFFLLLKRDARQTEFYGKSTTTFKNSVISVSKSHSKIHQFYLSAFSCFFFQNRQIDVRVWWTGTLSLYRSPPRGWPAFSDRGDFWGNTERLLSAYYFFDFRSALQFFDLQQILIASDDFLSRGSDCAIFCGKGLGGLKFVRSQKLAF